MKRMIAAALLFVCLGSASAAPQLLSGFEDGLTGWQTVGDVSAQNASSGLSPTQGTYSAFLTTMSGSENPFSGIGSPGAWQAIQYLGLPTGPDQNGNDAFLSAMPELHLRFPGGSWAVPDAGESGAMKFRFYVDAPSVLSFDWDRIGRDYDAAFFSVWADDSSGFRENDWLWAAPDYILPFGPSGVDLCPRAPTYCRPDFNLNGETGWQRKETVLTSPGWYYIGFAMGEVEEGSVPSVLAIDNLQIQAKSEVPEPWTAHLVVGALLALKLSTKLRQGSRRNCR